VHGVRYQDRIINNLNIIYYNIMKTDQEIINNMKYIVKEDRPIYGIYFISCIGCYLDIIKEQLEYLTTSELYKKSKRIKCIICSYSEFDYPLQSMLYNLDYLHIMDLVTSPDNLYEKFAINNFRSYIQDESYYLYYFHTKGVTHPNDNYFINIRRNLLFYLTHVDINLKLLKYFDAVGCDLSSFPKKHFSGNFWWSKSEHIKTLENVGNGYLAPEMYICSNSKAKYISLCQNAKTDQYQDTSNKSSAIVISQITTNELQNWADLNPFVTALL
jgi:hypothetical protein